MLFRLVAAGAVVVAEGVQFGDGSTATRSLLAPSSTVTFACGLLETLAHHTRGPLLIAFGAGDMQRFELVRDVDVSGSSGVGVVAQGVLFSDGSAALHWLPAPCTSGFYRDVAHVLEIHSHGGATRLRMLDLPHLPEPPELLTS